MMSRKDTAENAWENHKDKQKFWDLKPKPKMSLKTLRIKTEDTDRDVKDEYRDRTH